MVAACLLAGLTTTAQADTDVTARFLTNPSFEDGTTGWTVADLQTQTNNSFTLKHGRTYLERWTGTGGAVGSGSVMQKVSYLPAGNYRLTAAAHNIQQDKPKVAQTGAIIYAKSTSNKTTVTTTEDYSVDFATNGADVNIGFRATNASGNWICVDNFRLAYLGPDFALLQEAVANAETFASTTEAANNAGLQPKVRGDYMAAIDHAKAMAEDAPEADLQEASFTLAEAYKQAKENNEAMKSLKSLASKANTLLGKNMAEAYKTALQTAYDAAMTIVNHESDDDIVAATTALQTAYDAANASNTAYVKLYNSLRTANGLNKEDKEGVETLEAAIAEAQAVLDRADATPEDMDAATAVLDQAILFFRVQNGTGTQPKVRTLGVVQGATLIFARGSFASAKEKGFCYSENPEPTIYDHRVTTSYSNNGDIYYMENLKPATVYYVRAYAIGTGYKVGYGDVVKTVTLPLGNVTYDYDNAGDAATNQRINAACKEAVWMWNNVSGFRSFHLSAHYVPGAGAGDGTADCSYGGYMRISQNAAYQKTGTVLHEGAHGLGMVNYTDWVNPIYRTDGDRGDWLGARVDRAIQFLDNSVTAKLHGDYQHMWPYGINGAGEDSGAPMLYRGNALIVGALAEDGIRTPNMGFLKPAYVLTQDDDTKYYIKSADANRGLATAYLREGTNNRLQWVETNTYDALANDSCAWYVTFNPATCYYTLTNAATGKVVINSGSGTSGYKLANPTNSNTSSRRLHLLPARAKTTSGKFTFAGTAYWIVDPTGANAMNAATKSAVSSVNFNHADAAIAQRWLFLTAEEATAFAQANGEADAIRDISPLAEASIAVRSGAGQLTLTAVGAGQQVVVATLDGRIVSRAYVQQDATFTLNLPRGIYIVGGQKVMVR